MTSTSPIAGPLPTGMRVLGWLAAAGTLPYLALKAHWLAGGGTGVTDPAFLADPAVVAANAVTLAMDLVVVALAFTLTSRRGERLPAWLVLLPVWVGTGFLVPIAVSVLPSTLFLAATTGLGGSWFEPWLQPLVYGGFAWQGVFLCAAFVAYAVRRWPGAVTAAAPPAPALVPLLRVLTAGGCVMAALSAAMHLATGLGSGSAAALAVEVADAAFAVAGAVGVVVLLRARPGGRWAATAAAWTGSAAMFSWGLYTVVVRMAADGFPTYGAVAGTARVTGLLGGFALAVAGMLALVGTGESRRG